MNDENLRVEEVTEQYGKGKYKRLVQEDGGQIWCPIRGTTKEPLIPCDSRCAWWHVKCKIIENLGL